MEFSGVNATAGLVLLVTPAVIWTLLVFRRGSRRRERGFRLRAASVVWLATVLVAAFVPEMPGQVAVLAWLALVAGIGGSYRWLDRMESTRRQQAGAGSYLFSRKVSSGW